MLRTWFCIDRFCTLSTLAPGGRKRRRRARAPIEFVAERSSDHVADDGLARERARLVGDDVRAVAQDGDAVGDLERLFERVADEDDGDAVGAQSFDQREKMALLFRRQRRRRLVENDELGLEPHRARDLHHLPLGGAERLHGRGRLDREIERLQKLLRVDVGSAQPVEEFFVAEVEVLRHGHRRHEAGFLEHHGDAVTPGVRGTGDLNPFAFHEDLAAGRRYGAGEDFHQGRFSGAVLAEDGVNLAAAEVEDLCP